jgi:hypothetical protein
MKKGTGTTSDGGYTEAKIQPFVEPVPFSIRPASTACRDGWQCHMCSICRRPALVDFPTNGGFFGFLENWKEIACRRLPPKHTDT